MYANYEGIMLLNSKCTKLQYWTRKKYWARHAHSHTHTHTHTHTKAHITNVTTYAYSKTQAHAYTHACKPMATYPPPSQTFIIYFNAATYPQPLTHKRNDMRRREERRREKEKGDMQMAGRTQTHPRHDPHCFLCKRLHPSMSLNRKEVE